MSQAFVRESDDNGLLHQIQPTLPSLIKYLQAETKSQGVRLLKQEKKNGKEIYEMSNGLSYFIGNDNCWEVII